MLDKVDKRIANLVKAKAGDKLDKVLEAAEELALLEGKTPERSLADALDKYRLS
jgi:hypothetical protein